MKERETEGSACGPEKASSVGKGKEEGRKENVNHGGKMAETEVKKLSKDEEEQKEVEKEASRKILGFDPPQDDDKEEMKGEKGEMGKEESSDKQEKEVLTDKSGNDELPENEKKEYLKKVSTGKKDSLEIAAEVEKVLAEEGENDSSSEKALEELEPSKDEKCCGFMGIEPVGGRYVLIRLIPEYQIC